MCVRAFWGSDERWEGSPPRWNRGGGFKVRIFPYHTVRKMHTFRDPDPDPRHNSTLTRSTKNNCSGKMGLFDICFFFLPCLYSTAPYCTGTTEIARDSRKHRLHQGPNASPRARAPRIVRGAAKPFAFLLGLRWAQGANTPSPSVTIHRDAGTVRRERARACSV